MGKTPPEDQYDLRTLYEAGKTPNAEAARQASLPSPRQVGLDGVRNVIGKDAPCTDEGEDWHLGDFDLLRRKKKRRQSRTPLSLTWLRGFYGISGWGGARKAAIN